MALSTRSKLPAPVTCMRNVRGSPAAAVGADSSLAILNEPTAPLKSGGRPSVGNGNTVKSDGGLDTVISFGTVAPKKFCRKGSPSKSSIMESRFGRVCILTVSGDSAERENVPGFTAAMTLCQVITVYGLPSMTFSTRSG